MYEGHSVGVVVPAYNEAGRVGRVIEGVPDFVDRVYAVDDASTDDTWDEILSTARLQRIEPDGSGAVADGGLVTGQRERQVVPIQHDENRGVGGAIKSGYRRALADGVDVVAVMAGDDQMDPAELSRLLDPIVEGEADYAKGNRLLYPEHRASMSRWRLFGNALLSLLTKVASGYWKTMDPQNGYTAISREALETIDVADVFEDYGFTNALLVRLNVHDMRVADVAMPARYGDEESHIRYATFVPKLSALLARGFCWRLGRKYLLLDFHPLAFRYLLGVFATVVAAAFGAAAAGAALAGGSATANVATALVLGVLGGLALTGAMRDDTAESEPLEVRRT